MGGRVRCRHGSTTGLQRLIFKSFPEPSILGLKNKKVAELGGSHDVIMEASWSHDPNSEDGA